MLLTFILQVVVASVAAYFSANIYWWFPLAVYPILLKLFIKAKQHVDYYPYDYYPYVSPTSDPERYREMFEYDLYMVLLDSLIMIQGVAFTVVASVLCYREFHAWWGALVGIFVGLTGMALTAPRRWAWQFGRRA